MPVGLCEFEYRRAGLLQRLRYSPHVSPRRERQRQRDDRQSGRPGSDIESELSWTAGLNALPTMRTEDWMRENGIAHIDSRQYFAQQPRTDEGTE